jgi:hypothetical protein
MLSRPGWTPQATWIEYRHSIDKGEYDFSETTKQQQGAVMTIRTVHYFSGGVDFTMITIPQLAPLDAATQTRLSEAAVSAKPVSWHETVLFSSTAVAGMGPLVSNSKPVRVDSARSGAHSIATFVVVVVMCFLLLRFMIRRLRV